ncbi:hypothetical protein [Pseudokineococcus sp. 1T1Z-3]|uniref:hypothetical protein n=1 Tax=Pseudokineococcus sp. 1T1Z-3 TaxID=3132745 RepID=UPI0030A2B63A
MSLAEQVRQLLAHARRESPAWRGEWSVMVRPETFALLGQDLRPGVLRDPGDLSRGIETEMIDGCEVRAIDLRWDIVMTAPGLGGDPRTLPPHYYLDLTTGQVHTWTEHSPDHLNAQQNQERPS